MPEQPAQAFLSYAHADDDYLNGGITWLHEELQRAMRAITGAPFEIFLDKDAVAFGQHWPSRIEEALLGARFLIPMLSPSYFTSDACREEAEFFLGHEQRHGRRDLILPIYLIEADALELSTTRSGNYVARQFYTRQYADWRDVAFDLGGTPRIKQRTLQLAKQIKAASERVDKDAPPIVPAQGPGIRFGLNKDGKVDRAPDEPPDISDTDPRLCSLQQGLQDACTRFLGSFEGGAQDNVSGAHRPLINLVRDYREAITGKLSELQYTEVYRHGVALQHQMLARGRNVPRIDPPPPLEDVQEAAISDLLTFHANFMLSTKDGETLYAQTERAQITAEDRARLFSPALSAAAQGSDHATERAKAILADVNHPNEDGAAPERQALLALTTNRNFLTATGEAATGKDLGDIGDDATAQASDTASRFLLSNVKLVTQLATSAQYGLARLPHLLTWVRGQRAPASTARPAVSDAPAIVTSDLWTPGRVFRDIEEPWCPEMVVIPPGQFMMGSPEDEKGRRDDEGPQHLVTIEKPFALARFPVTFEEFDYFCDKTGAEKPGDEGWGRGKRPVIYVSWAAAGKYCGWLTRKTGFTYVLPSEAQWEYACRAGTTSAYAFGDTIRKGEANFGQHIGKTLDVGAYAANAFGLYDMHGNVWEWCDDHYHDSYEDAPANGSSRWEGRADGMRVLRGGSWSSYARNLRSARRFADAPVSRSILIGFRCARVQE